MPLPRVFPPDAIGMLAPSHRVRKFFAMPIALPFVYGIIAGALA